jgi:hypothetical protein
MRVIFSFHGRFVTSCSMIVFPFLGFLTPKPIWRREAVRQPPTPVLAGSVAVSRANASLVFACSSILDNNVRARVVSFTQPDRLR